MTGNFRDNLRSIFSFHQKGFAKTAFYLLNGSDWGRLASRCGCKITQGIQVELNIAPAELKFFVDKEASICVLKELILGYRLAWGEV